VNQNLADVSLALGGYSDALEYAKQARQCRIQLGGKLKILESTKTEGYARIYNGDEGAGKALVQEYSDSIRQLFDDDHLPSGDPFFSGAIVNGEFIPLERYARAPEEPPPSTVAIRTHERTHARRGR
jgi:hypothetical protein